MCQVGNDKLNKKHLTGIEHLLKRLSNNILAFAYNFFICLLRSRSQFFWGKQQYQDMRHEGLQVNLSIS